MIDKEKVLEAARWAYESALSKPPAETFAASINAAIEEMADQLNAILAGGEADDHG